MMINKIRAIEFMDGLSACIFLSLTDSREIRVQDLAVCLEMLYVLERQPDEFCNKPNDALSVELEKRMSEIKAHERSLAQKIGTLSQVVMLIAKCNLKPSSKNKADLSLARRIVKFKLDEIKGLRNGCEVAKS